MKKLLLFVSLAAAAQTRLDLRTQTRNVDFSGALSTRPVKVGTSLPAVCAAGELYFKSDAAAGKNLFGCVSADTWVAMSGSSAAGSTVSGPFYCADAGSANAYACTGVTGFAGYAAGQLVLLKPGSSNTGAATLNVNLLGAKPVRKNGTQAVAAGELAAGQVVSLVYDGAAFQVQALGIAGPAGPAIGGLLTSRGDTVGHNGSGVVRMPACPDGQTRIADSSQPEGWRCGTASAGSAASAAYVGGQWGAVTVNNTQSPPTIDLRPDAVCFLDMPCDFTSVVDMSGAHHWVPPVKLRSEVPAPGLDNVNWTYLVADCGGPGCATGGGAGKALLVSNGLEWTPLGGSADAGGATSGGASGAPGGTEKLTLYAASVNRGGAEVGMLWDGDGAVTPAAAGGPIGAVLGSLIFYDTSTHFARIKTTVPAGLAAGSMKIALAGVMDVEYPGQSGSAVFDARAFCLGAGNDVRSPEFGDLSEQIAIPFEWNGDYGKVKLSNTVTLPVPAGCSAGQPMFIEVTRRSTYTQVPYRVYVTWAEITYSHE